MGDRNLNCRLDFINYLELISSKLLACILVFIYKEQYYEITLVDKVWTAKIILWEVEGSLKQTSVISKRLQKVKLFISLTFSISLGNYPQQVSRYSKGLKC